RDLVNTPAADMGPDNLEVVCRDLAARFLAQISVISGADLLVQNLPMIHAVGRAADQAPRLIDLHWGQRGPKLTLVGKGVCFDTGGLNLKPGNSMGLMKKDMGGAANVLGLAQMIMALNLPLRLRVLIPAVENA
ncbi:MAG: leucyl aminopeptidase family protein, partial [Rhodobacterales bacterium]